MKSSGFTLIEVIIVIAIVMGLAAVGLVAGVDSYQRYLFRSDLDNAASLLQKARSSAINNVAETPHGVYFADPNNFVLFRGTSYASRIPSYDLAVGKSKSLTISGPTEAVFAQLSATTVSSTITLSDGVKNATITINNEGGINW